MLFAMLERIAGFCLGLMSLVAMAFSGLWNVSDYFRFMRLTRI